MASKTGAHDCKNSKATTNLLKVRSSYYKCHCMSPTGENFIYVKNLYFWLFTLSKLWLVGRRYYRSIVTFSQPCRVGSEFLVIRESGPAACLARLSDPSVRSGPELSGVLTLLCRAFRRSHECLVPGYHVLAQLCRHSHVRPVWSYLTCLCRHSSVSTSLHVTSITPRPSARSAWVLTWLRSRSARSYRLLCPVWHRCAAVADVQTASPWGGHSLYVLCLVALHCIAAALLRAQLLCGYLFLTAAPSACIVRLSAVE